LRYAPHLDSEVNVLTSEKWVSYLSLFEVSGYEMYETVGLAEVGEDEDQPADGGKVRNYERFKNSCRVSFELMREQNLSEEEQQAIGGI
jgi:hypothetical protein